MYLFERGIKPIGRTDHPCTTHARAPRGACEPLLVGPEAKSQSLTKKADELSRQPSGFALKFGVLNTVRP